MFRLRDLLRPLEERFSTSLKLLSSAVSKTTELRLLRLSSMPRSVVATGALFASWAPGDAFTEQGGDVTVG